MIDFDDEPQANPPPVTQLSTVEPASDVMSISAEEKELLVPEVIRTNFSTVYDPHIMQEIILDIATTRDTIENIIKKHGMASKTVYLWRSASAQLLQSWRAAMRHRTHVTADSFEGDAEKLEIQVETDDDYKRTSNRIRKFDRIWSYRTWFLSRYNRQDFGDKLDMTQEITVNQAKEREAAYNTFQQAAMAEFEEIPPLPGVKTNTTDPGPDLVG